MINAQAWLDKYYPQQGTCLRKGERWDINNLGKKLEVRLLS